MEQITELQKKRAVNIIWSCAGSHGFTPDFKAYDRDGCADLYWNCIIGAVRRHYDYPKLEQVFRGLAQYEDSDTYEGLLWLGLENCTYLREAADRPVLETLRKQYAEAYLRAYSDPGGLHVAEALEYAHYCRILGRESSLSSYDRQLLDELEFPAELTTDEIVDRAKALLQKWYQIRVQEKKRDRKPFAAPRLVKLSKKNRGVRFRRFGLGFADHPDNIYGGASFSAQQREEQLKTKMSASELRSFMETKYGKPCFPPQKISEIERSLCTGSHALCHLHFTAGDKGAAAGIQNGFEALQRQREAAQVEKNRRFYSDNLAVNRTAIAKLSAKIQNSVLLHLQSSSVKSNSGVINASKAWRAAVLDDEQVFSRSEHDDMGGLSVDILLDASTSQKYRQEIVSCQGYIIAESMTRCNIPCRVMSFCSMTGYTIMHIFRDYHSSGDNKRIFEYVSNGCNRDGLAISAAHYLINRSQFEHRILIVLSDVKPNDVVRLSSAGEQVPYEQNAGIRDTALEVRRARADGISVVCVFTGVDEDLEAAKTVYGRDFARIQSLEVLADTVARLIQNQIRNL